MNRTWYLSSREESEKIPCSRFLALSTTNYFLAIEDYFEEVTKDLVIKYDVKLLEYYRDFILTCIHCNDNTKNVGFLSLAIKLYDLFDDDNSE